MPSRRRFGAALAACAALTQLACPRADRPGRAATAPATPQPDPGLSAAAARALAEAFVRAGATPQLQGTSVRAAGHALVPRVTVGRVQAEPDHTVAAIDVALEVDGQRVEAFRVSSVAIDADRDEALARAVREWHVAYATPIVHALLGASSEPAAAGTPSDAGARAAGPPPQPLGPYRAYPGPTGVRGEAPEGWRRGSPEMHASLLRRIEPALDELIPPPRRPGFHSVKLTLHIRNATVGEGECLVDAVPSARLCELVRGYDWPQGPNEYLFKQFYVLAPAAR